MTITERQAIFPNELPIDLEKATRAVFVSMDQTLFVPHGVAESFKQLDRDYENDRFGQLETMERGVHSIGRGALDIAFRYGVDDLEESAVKLWMSPLNDGRPESRAVDLYKFLASGGKTPSVNHVKPNSWSPITKLEIDYEFGHAEGVGMPSVQVFAPEAQAFSREERRQIAAGDMTPYGQLARLALDSASRIKHQITGGEGFEKVHVFGAGMPQKALGAAVSLLESDYDVRSVTAMNLSIGERSLAKLSADYAGRRATGEAAKLILPENSVRIPEPLMRREIDGHGAELSMRWRQARALGHIKMVRAIMKAERGVDYIEHLLDNGSTVTIANSFNEPMVAGTKGKLPTGNAGLHFIDIVGVEGKKVNMMANEHAALVALVNAIGLKFHLQERV